MSDHPPKSSASIDVLQGYFDDLLAPPEAAEKPIPEPLPFEQKSSRVLKIQPEIQARPAARDPHEHSDKEKSRLVAERLAKAKLSRLLTSALPADETRKKVVVESIPRVESPIDFAKTDPDENSRVSGQSSSAEDAQTCTDDLLQWLENGRPAWAQQRFDVLLFEVSGLTLAVPLITLGQIQPLTEELTPLFGQADWFMGLQPTSTGKVNTVNTAKFVMPERYDDSFLTTARYVVSIDGLPWGLAVCAVNQPISLDPEDVKWRGDRSRRPWLAGTVKEHRCALLDIPTMGKILQDLDANRGNSV